MRKVEGMRSIWIDMMFDVEPMRCFLSFIFSEMVEDRIVISTSAVVSMMYQGHVDPKGHKARWGL